MERSSVYMQRLIINANIQQRRRRERAGGDHKRMEANPLSRTTRQDDGGITIGVVKLGCWAVDKSEAVLGVLLEDLGMLTERLLRGSSSPRSVREGTQVGV